MTNLTIKIDNASANWNRAFSAYKKKINQAAACAFAMAKKPAAFNDKTFDINIILTTDANIKKINKNYRGKDKATNVLSFPQFNFDKPVKKSELAIFPSDMSIPLGDIILANQTIKREAKAEGKEFEDHVIHLIVHGVLHLLGHDHMTDKDAKKMEKLELKVMEALDYPNPYEQ